MEKVAAKNPDEGLLSFRRDEAPPTKGCTPLQIYKKQYYIDMKYTLSKHFLERLAERKISIEDVLEILEGYVDHIVYPINKTIRLFY